MTHVSAAGVDALRRSLGLDAVDTSEETLARYGRNLLPGGDRRPAGVVYPASTADVREIVRIANEHRVTLYSFSTGENRGNGLRSSVRPGHITDPADCRWCISRRADLAHSPTARVVRDFTLGLSIAYGTGAGARRNSLRRTTRQSTNGSWPSTVIHRTPRCSPATWCGRDGGAHQDVGERTESRSFC